MLRGMNMKRMAWYLVPAILVAMGIWNSWRGPPMAGPAVSDDTQEPATGTAEETSDEDLFFPSKVADLGTLKAPITHDFAFENRASAKAEILEVSPSCNCTIPKMDKKVFQPGETGKVTVQVDLGGRKIGPQLFVINIRYRTFLVRETRLVVRAVYRPDIVLPTELKVRSVKGGGSQRIPFAVVDYRDEPFLIEHISTSSADLKVEMKDKPSSYLPGWKYELDLVVRDKDQPVGNYSESINLQTNDPEHQRLSVPVSVERVSRIRVSPAVLSLKPDVRPGIQIGNVFIDDREGDTVEIDSVDLPNPALEWKVNPNFAGTKVYQVALNESKLSGGQPGSFRIKLRFKKPVQEETCINVVRKP